MTYEPTAFDGKDKSNWKYFEEHSFTFIPTYTISLQNMTLINFHLLKLGLFEDSGLIYIETSRCLKLLISTYFSVVILNTKPSALQSESYAQLTPYNAANDI